MTTAADDNETKFGPDEMKQPCESGSSVQSPMVPEQAGMTFNAAPLPWIGALPNPRLGPMVVIDESGYLVPICTAGDLLRGFRMLWRISRE